jgi:hypothetical protein
MAYDSTFDNQRWANWHADYERNMQKSSKSSKDGSVDDLIAGTSNNDQLDLDKFIPPLDESVLDPQSK